MKKGIFITFEGIDWSGKTTQIKFLVKYLKKQGIEPLVTREPGGTRTGMLIKKILRDPNLYISPRTELFLFAADCAQHVEEVIRPAIIEGRLVISDRYYHSTLVYQHYGRGLSFRDVMETIKLAVKGVEPDLTIVLDLSLEEAKKRLPSHLDRIEEDMALEKIIKAYREIAKNHPEKIAPIDASPDPQTVHREVVKIIQEKFPEIFR